MCVCVCVTPESSTKPRMALMPRDAAGPLMALTDGTNTVVMEVDEPAVATSGRPESNAAEFAPNAITYVLW